MRRRRSAEWPSRAQRAPWRTAQSAPSSPTLRSAAPSVESFGALCLPQPAPGWRCVFGNVYQHANTGTRHVCDANCQLRQWDHQRSIFVCPASGECRMRTFAVSKKHVRRREHSAGSMNEDDEDDEDDEEDEDMYLTERAKRRRIFSTSPVTSLPGSSATQVPCHSVDAPELPGNSLPVSGQSSAMAGQLSS
ncbi:MAG: hypothetical protein MHM6MM_007818 [Cercozoa sp. M6MM]